MWTCSACGWVSAANTWKPQCFQCKAWETLVHDTAAAIRAVEAPRANSPARAIRELAEPAPATRSEPPASRFTAAVDVVVIDPPRTATGIASFDRVLGANDDGTTGLVEASAILLSGDSGAGKSSLAGAVLGELARRGKRVGYETAEETVSQVTSRLKRIGALVPGLLIVCERDIDQILRLAISEGIDVLLVDSISTVHSDDAPGISGSPSQVGYCTARLCSVAKDVAMTVILIGHVTRSGDAAGGKRLEHLVDVTLELVCDDTFANVRTLYQGKNRFGNVATSGQFEMTARGLVSAEDEVIEDRRERDRGFEPLAQELLSRFLAGGGRIDAGLSDRIAGRLDVTAWQETRYASPTAQPGGLPDLEFDSIGTAPASEIEP